ncbi:unnamed protein product [Cylindrotheca closterium]|nr:unnamed protein product [Cylindrotheca closterium]
MQKLKDFAGCLKEEAHQYDSVYLTPHSWTSALQSVSSLCKLVDHILLPMGEIELSKFSLPSNKKPVRFGFACIRPPGHHASSSLANGYCLINHVAVAATYALEYFGGRFGDAELVQDESPKSSPKNSYPFLRNPKPQRRVAILDWDIHHGDGTQSIFWNDPNVLFCSIHAQKAFPFVSGSSAKSVGGPNAFGRTVNVAWTSHGMGDNEYVYALQTLILPILQEFQPTLILISAGFDAATGDSYCGNLSPVNGFGRMTTEILRVATEMDCPVIASLEGGYKQSVLVPCVASVVQSMVVFGEESIMTRNENDERNFLKGFANDALVGTTSSINHAITGSIASSIDGVCPTAVKNIEATRAAQQQFWKCLSVNHLKQER